jgi:hypothetical protein
MAVISVFGVTSTLASGQNSNTLCYNSLTKYVTFVKVLLIMMANNNVENAQIFHTP